MFLFIVKTAPQNRFKLPVVLHSVYVLFHTGFVSSACPFSSVLGHFPCFPARSTLVTADSSWDCEAVMARASCLMSGVVLASPVDELWGPAGLY